MFESTSWCLVTLEAWDRFILRLLDSSALSKAQSNEQIDMSRLELISTKLPSSCYTKPAHLCTAQRPFLPEREGSYISPSHRGGYDQSVRSDIWIHDRLVWSHAATLLFMMVGDANVG
jgi:hypothetical protein